MPNIKIQRTAEVMLSERIEILAAADLGVRRIAAVFWASLTSTESPCKAASSYC
jgi:hypothetical protein